jgi:hypothetical protein
MIVTDIISEEVDPNDDVNIEAIMERAARHRSTAQTVSRQALICQQINGEFSY